MSNPAGSDAPSLVPNNLPDSPNAETRRALFPTETRPAFSSPETRRAFLRQALGAGGVVGAALVGASGCGRLQEQTRALTGPTPATWLPLPVNAGATAIAAHVLNRVAFGPKPGDMARVTAMGAPAYLETQLADAMDEDPTVTWRVNGLDVQQATEDAPDLLASLSDDQLLTETGQATLLRATYSSHQLRETLADFWTNHFNIYALKNEGRVLIPVDAERVIRPHALGRFADLLRASARSPAMLAYLDNQQNRRGVVNENYARELLELHTLGVRSGYTQHDIQEVARCFTGWTVKTGFQRGQFAYDAARHDTGAKYIPFLNLTIASNGGQSEAETVLEHLAAHPATARFVSRKLCRRFLGTAPDATVEAASRAYLRSGGDIRATLRPILLDALLTPEQNRPILKRPLEMLVSALRVLHADTDGGPNLQRHLSDMGQPLYQWPMPDGFPEKTSSWTGSLLPRWNFAFALTANAINGTTVDLNAPLQTARAQSPAAIGDALLETVLARPHDAPELAETRRQLNQHLASARQAGVPEPTVLAEACGLLLSAPAFQWK